MFDLFKMSAEKAMESIIKYHNHSWFEDIYMRNKKNKDKTAFLFKGTKITYGEFFIEVKRFAKALRANGIGKGDTVFACLRNQPEFPFLFGAVSLVGAKIVMININFKQDFLEDILKRSGCNLIFINDYDFLDMFPLINNSANDKKIVLLPVDTYLKAPDPHKRFAEKFRKTDHKLVMEKFSSFTNRMSETEFLFSGVGYTGNLNAHGRLEDELVITFTSGTTSKGWPKGVVHRNKSYIIMGRYHDPEVAGVPRMDNIVTLSEIAPHADTTIMTGLSDTLMQSGTYVLEPLSGEGYFLYSLIFNKPSLVIATRSTWIDAMRLYRSDKRFKGVKMPFLTVPSEGGEPLSKGEEDELNLWLDEIHAGNAPIPLINLKTKMSVGGGDSEHGSIFLVLFRSYYDKLQKLRRIDEPIGMGYYNLSEVKVLRKDGSYCKPMEIGRLVANSAIQMKEYYLDPEATKRFYIKDKYGKIWGDLNVYGYIDKWNNVYVKGRISENDPQIKNYEIAEEILKDYKRIMSCEVINIGKDNPVYIAHTELRYGNINEKAALLDAERRCMDKFGDKLNGRLLFRLRSHEEGYPVIFTAKRSAKILEEEGITDKCFKPHIMYK